MCMAVGFNRYMVECEYGLLSAGATDDDVLIDTWWNVNIARSSYINATTLVLIDTWWNVNLKRGYITQQELEF